MTRLIHTPTNRPTKLESYLNRKKRHSVNSWRSSYKFVKKLIFEDIPQTPTSRPCMEIPTAPQKPFTTIRWGLLQSAKNLQF